MSVVKIRLARGGAKKRPHYSIVVARSNAPRDGAFLEKVGYYNPMLEKDNPARVMLKVDRINHWMSVGAQPTDKVAHFISLKGATLTEKIKGKIARTVKKRSENKQNQQITG